MNLFTAAMGSGDFSRLRDAIDNVSALRGADKEVLMALVSLNGNFRSVLTLLRQALSDHPPPGAAALDLFLLTVAQSYASDVKFLSGKLNVPVGDLVSLLRLADSDVQDIIAREAPGG